MLLVMFLAQTSWPPEQKTSLVYTLHSTSPYKGVEGDLFMTYVVVMNASTQNFLDNFACANILRTCSMMV